MFFIKFEGKVENVRGNAENIFNFTQKPLLGYAKKQNAKSYHVPLERAGAVQAKKPAKFGQNGLSVPATIS